MKYLYLVLTVFLLMGCPQNDSGPADQDDKDATMGIEQWA